MSEVNHTVESSNPDPVAAELRARAAQVAPVIRMLRKDTSGHSFVTFRTGERILDWISRNAAKLTSGTEASDRKEPVSKPEVLFVPYVPRIEEQGKVVQEVLVQSTVESYAKPCVIALERVGVFIGGRSKAEADTRMQFLLEHLSTAGSGIERFHSISNIALPIPRGRMAGKIAIVTGGAQGFGSGIGAGLLREGAHVIFADLNAERVQESVEKLVEEYGRGRAFGIGVDVTREVDVQRMIEETVLEHGGVDLLISNAGILRAGSLEEMDLDSFEAVNRVNYTGFFLCTKYTSRPMKLQHRFDPSHFADIIQINSKSGLSGSNKNFAYAGSKFGSIGLTQSFALELVPFNIKVNAICPGNLFDGPLWSDPEKGLFRQYLDTGKVSGARTIQDVRRAYEEKVPMRRGCRIEDVVRAVLYIVEQEYETGQAVPVTGGQIMLK